MKADLLTAILTGVYGSAYTLSDHFYNGYRKSISDINWGSVVHNLLLSAIQAMKLYELNHRYQDYNSWNNMYSENPDQWRSDRYSELEAIFGTEKYNVFKSIYYNGQDPIDYYNRNKNTDKRNRHMDRKVKEYRIRNGNRFH